MNRKPFWEVNTRAKCIYCGRRVARNHLLACSGHSDLLTLDPGAPLAVASPSVTVRRPR